MKRYLLKFLLVIVSIILVSCSGGKCASGCSTPPQTQITDLSVSVAMDTEDGGIADRATNVSLTPSIILKFSAPMDPATVNWNNIVLSTTQVSSAGGSVKEVGNIIGNADDTIFYFSLSTPLASNATYYITVTGAAISKNGTNVTPRQFSFTTGNFIAPTVSILSPTNHAIGVSALPNIQIKFSESVKNVNNTTLTLHAGSVNGVVIPISQITAGTDNTYTFSPLLPLNSVTNYYLVLSNGIIDNYNNALATTTFNFTTGDFIAPTVSAINPSNNASDISVSPNISIRFSESVTNVNTNNITLHEGSPNGNIIPISLITAGANNTYVFAPLSLLKSMTIYYIVLNNQITDIDGNHLVAVSFDFTTGDFIAPTVSILYPGNNAQDISTSPNIQIKFSKPVKNVNLTNVTLRMGSESGVSIPLSSIIASPNNIYTFNPSSPLNSATLYYIVLESGITDLSSNNLAYTSFYFTTRHQVAYVVNSGGLNGLANSVSMCPIDSVGNIASCTKVVGGFDTPYGIALNSVGTIAYITNYDGGSVYMCVINGDGTLTNCKNAVVGMSNFVKPYGVVLNPAGTIAYVTNDQNTANDVSMCKVNNDGTLSNCAVAGSGFENPRGIVLNNSGTIAYVTNYSGNSVSMCHINPIDGSFEACVNSMNGLTGAPDAVTLNPSGTILYVTDNLNSSVSMCPVNINNTLGNCTNTLGNGYSSPLGVTINNTGTMAYVTNHTGADLSFCSIDNTGIFSNCGNIQTGFLSLPVGIVLGK